MCIGLWSLKYPDYALILCANRDEYLSRPTVDAHFHSFDQPSGNEYVLSGRDLQAGGSWLGINRDGKVALLTNITEVHGVHRSSRGHLVSQFLLPGVPSIDHYIGLLATDAPADYAGFNLLVLSLTRESDAVQRISYDGALITNSGGGGVISARSLHREEKRLGGVSTGVDGIDADDWPKVKKGYASLDKALSEDEGSTGVSPEKLAEKLFDVLTWQPDPPPANAVGLRNAVQITLLRVSATLAPDSSSSEPIYYGTRLSTVVLVRRDGSVLFVERDIWKLDDRGSLVRGRPKDDRSFRFDLRGH